MLSRTRLLLGDEAIEKLNTARVAVFGVGGVGGYAVEALVRCGIGNIDVIDSDVISESNLNRQIIALTNTLGKKKVEAVKDRALSINPKCHVETFDMFFLPDNADKIDFSQYDYVIDAVDTVSAKIEIVRKAKEAGVAVISAMGTGNKLDASAFQVSDIYKTKQCPLARVMRRELKARGIRELKVVYSEEPAKKIIPCTSFEEPAKKTAASAKAEEPVKNTVAFTKSEQLAKKTHACEKTAHGEQGAEQGREDCGLNAKGSAYKKAVPGSVSFVPPVAGFLLAGEVIKDICGLNA